MIVRAPMVNLTGLFIFISTAFSAGGKRLNKKITKIERTISISEAKHLSVCRLTSKAMDNNSISDIEFNSNLLELEQNYSLKSSWEIKQEAYLRLMSRPFKKQVKEEYQKEIRSLVNIMKQDLHLKRHWTGWILFLQRTCKFNLIKYMLSIQGISWLIYDWFIFLPIIKPCSRKVGYFLGFGFLVFIQWKMPFSEELTMRFQRVCEKIQNSIKVVESHMGEWQEIQFEINQAIHSLEIMDISQRDRVE